MTAVIAIPPSTARNRMEENSMYLLRMTAFILVMSCVPAFCQNAGVTATPITDSDIQLLRQDLQAEKNKIIADTMTFSTQEATAFWPVYEDYAKEQHAIAQQRLELITEYAKSLDNLTDAKAHAMTERLLTIQGETLALRKKYLPRFEKALGAKRAANASD